MKQIHCISIFVLLMFILMFGSINSVSAQFTFGAQVAVNASNFIDESSFDVGCDAGLFFRIGKRVFFEPEVNYVFRNTYLDESVANGNSQNLKQHFIDVPMLVGFHVINNPSFKFELFLGPRLGFRLADNWKDQQTEFDRVQWGGQVGVGIDIWRFVLTGRYDISGSKFKNVGDGTGDFWKQNMFVVSLGFKIVR